MTIIIAVLSLAIGVCLVLQSKGLIRVHRSELKQTAFMENASSYTKVGGYLMIANSIINLIELLFTK